MPQFPDLRQDPRVWVELCDKRVIAELDSSTFEEWIVAERQEEAVVAAIARAKTLLPARGLSRLIFRSVSAKQRPRRAPSR